MKKNKFDIHAQEMFQDHEVEVNTDALWNSVQAELHPENKKRFGWVWFSASSILGILLLSSFLFFNSEKNVDQTSNHLDIATSENNINKSEINIDESSPVSETVSPSINETKLNNLENTDSQKTTKKITQLNKKNKTTSTVTKQNIPPTSKPQVSSKEKNIVASSVVADKIESKATNIKETAKAESKTKTTTQKDKTQPIEEKAEEDKTDLSNDQTDALNFANEVDNEAPEYNLNSNDSSIASGLDKEEGLENPDTAENGNDGITEDKENEDNEDNNDGNVRRRFKRDFQFGAGFRAGISNSLTTLTANGDDNMALRLLRSDSETNLETIDLGLDILLKHKSGLYLSTGLDYLRAARKLDFNSEVTVTDSVLGVATIYVNPITMDTTYEEGFIDQTTTTTRRKEVFNNLHVVNIPVNLGVTLNYDRWLFGVQGGASFNVFLHQKGQIRDSDSTFYDIGEDSENWFKDNIGVTFQGAALIGYNFTDNFQIVGGPSFRSPIVISEDINPVKQSLVGLGLQVNARYWFD